MTNIAYATAQVPLNDDNSRLLGVGDRLVGEIYWRAAMTTHPDIWLRMDEHDELYGKEVTEDMTTLYRAMLEPQRGLTTFATGSVRENKAGKGRYDLIPLEGIRALALHYERGASRHGDRNWELGQPLSVFKNSLTRHACQVAYAFDEDHAAAVAWNAFGYITTMERIRAGLLPAELDDLGVCNKEVVR